MSTPRLLDLFCGAGGAGEGYARAGFTVVGVDLDPAPLRHNPHECYQGAALAVLDTLLAGETWRDYTLADFAAIHASPPCQGYSASKPLARTAMKTWQPLIGPVRKRLEASDLPWVIENVNGARREMRWPLRLCGTHFALRVYRHRLFETSMPLFSPGQCKHPHALADGYLCVYGNGARRRQTGNRGNQYQRCSVVEARAAMGIEWMTQKELSQAIPPAYTEFIGHQLLSIVESQAA